MSDRRSFMKRAAGSAAGLVFCSCGLLDAAHAQSQLQVKTARNPRRGPLFIKGQRVKTIDTHTHCYFQESIDLMGDEAKDVLPQVKGVPAHFMSTEDTMASRLHAMDEQAVDMQVLSINPFWYRKDPDTARAICEMNNQKLGEVCAAHPDRFAAFASLTMQVPELAVQQLETAVKKYKLKGAAIGGTVAGEDFSNPKFRAVLAKAEELDVVLFIHPQSTPELAKRFKGNGWLSNTIGNPLDTTIALQHLIFEGTFDQLPNLKILAAHGGGFLGSYAPRSDRSCFVSPQNCDPNIVLKKKPTEYVTQMYFDSLVFTSEGLRHLVTEVGAGHVVMGSDQPIPWVDHPVDHIMDTPTLSDAQRVAILSTNAAKLLHINV
jgi:predicted TIM-barrel fold metal-dependent hydrolase